MAKKSEPTNDDIRAALIPLPDKPFQIKDLLSTGSTLLDLACSGHWQGGLIKGHYYFFVGDSSSGKTFFTMTCFSEASINPQFKDYRFIYDNVEDGALMSISKFFGKAVAQKLEPPALYEDGAPCFSRTVEDFWYNLDDAVKDERRCIYVVDSMDALTSVEEGGKFDKHKAFTQGATKVKPKGDFGDGKAKINSRNARRIMSALRDTGSILIIVNQTRDNVGGGPFDPKKVRSGGHALTFYATLEIWSSKGGNIKTTLHGKDRIIGNYINLRVKKNRVAGRDRRVTVGIYPSFGIDDLGSCIDYLIEEKHWPTRAGEIKAKEFGFVGTRDALIKCIEDAGLQTDLKSTVGDVWADIERKLVVDRKPRY